MKYEMTNEYTYLGTPVSCDKISLVMVAFVFTKHFRKLIPSHSSSNEICFHGGGEGGLLGVDHFQFYYLIKYISLHILLT